AARAYPLGGPDRPPRASRTPLASGAGRLLAKKPVTRSGSNDGKGQPSLGVGAVPAAGSRRHVAISRGRSAQDEYRTAGDRKDDPAFLKFHIRPRYRRDQPDAALDGGRRDRNRLRQSKASRTARNDIGAQHARLHWTEDWGWFRRCRACCHLRWRLYL